jgi:hypothetical protein
MDGASVVFHLAWLARMQQTSCGSYGRLQQGVADIVSATVSGATSLQNTMVKCLVSTNFADFFGKTVNIL